MIKPFASGHFRKSMPIFVHIFVLNLSNPPRIETRFTISQSSLFLFIFLLQRFDSFLLRILIFPFISFPFGTFGGFSASLCGAKFPRRFHLLQLTKRRVFPLLPALADFDSSHFHAGFCPPFSKSACHAAPSRIICWLMSTPFSKI